MKTDPLSIREKVSLYLKEKVHVDSNKIQDKTLIFKEGFIDSMGFIVLITFLEEEFSIRTNDSDLIEENFESINAITDFVTRKSEV